MRMLSTGEMIDSLKRGEVAECVEVPHGQSLLGEQLEYNGLTLCYKGSEMEFQVNNFTKKMKWRILPQYVTFEEAKKAYEEGKTIKCEYPGKFDGVIYCETFNKREPEDVEALSMYMITEGKWSVEDDS